MLSGHLRDREFAKFVETVAGKTAVRVVGEINTSDSVVAVPIIQNQTLENSNEEYEINVPANCLSIHIRSRNLCRLQFSFAAGETSSNYFSVPVGSALNISRKISSDKIYVRSDKTNTILEMLFLTN